MKSFKTRENVLTRRESLDYTRFSKGLRIIERLYPMPKGQNAWNPLIYKGSKHILPWVGIQKKRWYFERDKFLCAFINHFVSMGYDLFSKVGVLKLSRVLTCKKLPCMNIACAMRQASGCFEPYGGVSTYP